MTERIKRWVDGIGPKVILASSLSVGLPWAIWVTSTQYADHAFRNLGDRFSKLDGAQMELRFDRRLDALPPQDWRDRISRFEREIEMLDDEMRRMEAEFTSEFMRKDEHAPH